MQEKKKCSFKQHHDIDSIKYCQECKIYMCNKCLNNHQGLFENHNQYNLDKDSMEMLLDTCEENNHPNKLEFFCKTHNKLCCGYCITKIKGKGYGQHKDCDVCFIENIKEEKKNKLAENIKYLDNLSNNLDKAINELKNLFEKINENKEELKLKIQKIFTNLRNSINQREDELLLEVDQIYNNEYCNEDIIKEGEKLPNKIKMTLEKSKLIDNEWNDNNKLISIINICIKIENNIKDINLINNNINKCKLNKDLKIDFSIDNEFSNKYIENIKNFGKISKVSIDIGLINKIIKNYEEATDLCKFLFKDKIVKFDLLYQATRDGDEIPNVIKKIEGYTPTLFLVYTKKGIKCGGYTKALWKADSEYKNDSESFLFNFNKKKIYYNKKSNESIICNNKYYICFGNFKHSDYYIRNKFLTQGVFENTNKISYNSNDFDVQEENDSKINELEIYKCNF